MSKDPAFLFYTSDFLTGTILMTNEEIGAYVRLLCLQHQHGHFDANAMQRLCGGNPTALLLSKFKQDEGGLYFNERLELEIIKRRDHSEKQKQNALMRWHKSGNPMGMPLENENEIEDEDVNKDKGKSPRKPLRNQEGFDDFWKVYSRKDGKGAAKQSWSKLTDEEKMVATEKAKIYSSLPDCVKENHKYQKHASTWLNGRCWEDESLNHPVDPPSTGYIVSYRNENGEVRDRRITSELYEVMKKNSSINFLSVKPC